MINSQGSGRDERICPWGDLDAQRNLLCFVRKMVMADPGLLDLLELVETTAKGGCTKGGDSNSSSRRLRGGGMSDNVDARGDVFSESLRSTEKLLVTMSASQSDGLGRDKGARGCAGSCEAGEAGEIH
ncbi:hypothetical protein FGB62_102g03 [Gracilaria domingensis]|nr:hypothetical protein FGB62_102g03 [Gracilaria domingensis]